MKFEEWYLKNREQGSHVDMDDAEKGWLACKQEVLKIIERFDKERCQDFLKLLIKKEI